MPTMTVPPTSNPSRTVCDECGVEVACIDFDFTAQTAPTFRPCGHAAGMTVRYR